MSGFNHIEKALIAFQGLLPELRAAVATVGNESETRFRIIDRVFCELLGWPRELVKTEQVSDAGYLDYMLVGDSCRGQLVLEAKASGLLALASASTKRQVLKLSGPVMKPLRPGVEQALGYATAKGLPFGAVSDGNTWAFFRASRTDGVAPIDGKAIVYPDLKAVEANFSEFYELLGYPAVIERLNQLHLSRAEGLVTAR